MSATEIIAEIQKLPDAEMQRVLEFLNKKPASVAQPQISYADDADFDKAAAEVLHENAELFRRLAQ